MSEKFSDFHKWNDELSDRETFFIGKIVAQWGGLEYEVFAQTLLSFDGHADLTTTLPKAMNNLQFTALLELWKERVVDKIDGERGEVLQQQFEKIGQLKVYRDALVHGMWEWARDDLSVIRAVRVRKKEIISARFTVNDLEDFYGQLGSINFKLRYPGGIEEFAEKESGGGFTRLGLGLITGHPIAGEWIASVSQKAKKNSAPDT